MRLLVAGDEPKESKGRAASSNKGKDRKSPNTIQTESAANDSDDEKKGSEPKVPPLKIVLSNSSEADTNVRYGAVYFSSFVHFCYRYRTSTVFSV